MKAISKVGEFLADLGPFAAVFGLVGLMGAALKPAETTVEPIEWTASSDEPLCFPMGTRVPVAGSVNHRATYGPTNRYQSIVSTLGASGPIQAFLKTTIDDEEITFGANGVSTNGKNQGDLWLQTRRGLQPETALSSPAGLDGGAVIPNWGSDHKMSGRPADMLTMKENSKFTGYQGGVPKRLHVVAGLYGWDPRADSTWPGGSGACRLDTPSTWLPIKDGAIAALNWAIGRWEGPSGGGKFGVPYACSLVGGVGATLASVRVEDFIQAANVADANDWLLIACPDTKEDRFNVFTKLLAAAGAMPCRIAGRIGCITRAAPQPAILTVGADLLAGPVDIQPMPSRLERKNAVIARYTSEAHRFELTAIHELGNPVWLTEDRGRKRYLRPDYQYVPDPDHVASLAYLDLADAREPIKGSAPFKPVMRQIEPGDCLVWDLPGTALDGVKVRVLRRTTNQMTGTVQLQFRQDTDQKYEDAGVVTGVVPPDVTPDTPPVRPGVPAEPPITRDDDGGAVTGGTTVINVASFNVVVSDGPVGVVGGTISGLAASKTYGIFYKPGAGLAASELPSFDYMSGDIDGGGWIFLGWQSTDDGSGTYPTRPTLPPGSGGTGDTPAYVE